MAQTRTIYRSSITGQFVSKEYAEANPDTTQRHVITFKERD